MITSKIVKSVIKNNFVWPEKTGAIAIQLDSRLEYHLEKEEFEDVSNEILSAWMERGSFMAKLESLYPGGLTDSQYDAIEQFCFKLYDSGYLLHNSDK